MTIVQKSKLLKIAAVVILVSVAFFAVYVISSPKTTGQAVFENEAVVQISAGNGHVLGGADAPVTIIEFSDFQCPFCARFVEQAMPQIKEDYIDTGKVKMVFRNFPLRFHENAESAALAAECANEQGRFWEYHDKIFQNQAYLGMDNYRAWAVELGLNAGQFNSCLDSGKYAENVQKDAEDGAKAGVTGTPTFFVNGQKIVGAQPYSAFKIAIDNALNG